MDEARETISKAGEGKVLWYESDPVACFEQRLRHQVGSKWSLRIVKSCVGGAVFGHSSLSSEDLKGKGDRRHRSPSTLIYASCTHTKSVALKRSTRARAAQVFPIITFKALNEGKNAPADQVSSSRSKSERIPPSACWISRLCQALDLATVTTLPVPGLDLS